MGIHCQERREDFCKRIKNHGLYGGKTLDRGVDYSDVGFSGCAWHSYELQFLGEDCVDFGLGNRID
jgi:hypothetical protein